MNNRTVAVTIKLSKTDLEKFLKCKEDNWKDVPITRSTLLLTLARLGCESLDKKKKPKA